MSEEDQLADYESYYEEIKKIAVEVGTIYNQTKKMMKKQRVQNKPIDNPDALFVNEAEKAAYPRGRRHAIRK